MQAIANMTQRHIITVSLESIKTKRQLKALFHDERLHVENTEAREGFETYRIPINKRLFVLEVCHVESAAVCCNSVLHIHCCRCRTSTPPPTWCWTDLFRNPNRNP